MTTMIAAYIDRLNALAADRPIADRFWIAVDDVELLEMEDLLCEHDGFYDAIIRQYGEWRDALTNDQWNDVLRRNRERGGANMNWLIEEL